MSFRTNHPLWDINSSNMTEIELYNELQNVEGSLKKLDSQISELRKKKNDIMNDFLSQLPYQKGDKVKDKKWQYLYHRTSKRCHVSWQE